MKKNIVSLTAAVVASVSLLCGAGVPVLAEENDPGYVKEVVEYTEPDPFVIEMKVTWTDEQGNRYSHKLVPQEETTEAPAPMLGSVNEEKEDDKYIVSSSVTWYDGAGNKYVNDGTTVTVFDPEGNVIGSFQA